MESTRREHETLVTALAEMENRFRIFSETSVQGKMVLSAFRPLFANAVAARILGYRDVLEVTKRFSVLNQFDADVRRNPEAAERLAMSGLYEGQAVWTRRDGETIHVALASRPIRWCGQDAFVIAFTDISQQISAERAANDAQARIKGMQAAKHQMLTAVSHRLRTPLHAMMGRMGVLLAEDLPPQSRRLVQDAVIDARRLLVQIDDLLDGAAVDSRAPHLRAEPFDLGDAVDDAVQIAASGFTSGALPVRVVAPRPGQVSVRGDRRRLTRIVLAMLEGGLARCAPDDLNVSVASDADGVRIDVWGQRSEFAQTGLMQHASEGLKLASSMAEALGGGVSIERADGDGYRLAGSVPFPAAVNARKPQPSALRAGVRVLSADDHPGNRRLIALVLEAFGCVVTSVDSGEAALEAIAQDGFDLIILDIMMPGLDGIETARRIRAGRPEWCETPIIALTADVSDRTRDAAESAGMDAVLTKPIEPRMLAEVLAILAPGADVLAAPSVA